MIKTYSITKNGNDYLIGTEQQSVLRLSSRRKAAKIVTEASELLTTEEEAPPSAEHAEKIDGAESLS